MNTATATPPQTDTDRIERSILIQSPRARVWQALSRIEEFGKWFGANLKGTLFAPGMQVVGPLTICNYEHVMFDALIEQVLPESVLSYRWHPYAVDAKVDYSKEPRTLVTFTLQDSAQGTLLTVVESGFDKLPPERRITALQMNTRGWEAQLKCVERHVTAS